MEQRAFEARLAAEGFDEVVTKDLPPGPELALHSHPYAVKALVVAGSITLGVDGARTTYRAGDVFALAPGCEHTECYGANGVRFVLGRRHG